MIPRRMEYDPAPTGPPENEPDHLLDDPRLMQAVQEYLAELEAGRTPNRADFLGRYPELAGPLAQCLDGLDLVQKAVVKLPHSAGKSGATPGVPPETLPSKVLGDFQIIRELGRGGMGVVYEAVQLSLGRRVALKVLPLAATFDANCLQRFRNEAEAAAALHHTNIVPVYAVGCERGVHFYAMQLIDGQALSTILDQIRNAGDSKGSERAGDGIDSPGGSSDASGQELPPERMEQATFPLSRALSTYRAGNRDEFYRSLTRFMLQAAEGLEHAHQYGIVHRDIKPANLLVDLHGRLWITDFGLAQFHAESGLTRTGDILGTLRYMSPEQASGQRLLLDHRTDIYSLGATFYELATLRPMFAGRTSQELLHQILHDEPPAPRAVEKSVPVDLETIILKAVSKNPADRYGSARDLAGDLKRYLEDKPIRAKRPGLVQRFRKWSRRHPSAIVAAVVLLVFGVIGFAVSTIIIAGAYSRERQRAEEAEERFNLARRSADEMIRIAQEDLLDKPHMQDVRRRLLEAALVYYQEFIEQRRGKPDSQAELAVTRDLVKNILDDLAVLQGAGRHFLLQNPSVLDDLELSRSQRDQMSELLGRMGQERQQMFESSHGQAPEERQQALLEMIRSHDAAIGTILTSGQLDRLWQIARQCQGPLAFQDPEVVRKLNLTPEQKKQIRSIETTMFIDRPPFGPPDKPGPRPPGMWNGERRNSVLNQILQLLTEEQTARWNELTGKPFAKADEMFAPGSPPGGFPHRPPPPRFDFLRPR